MSWLTQSIPDHFELEKHAFSHQDEVYKITTSKHNYYLKISPTLKAEYENPERMKPFLKVPNIIAFDTFDDGDHLLLSEVPGKKPCRVGR